MQLTQFTDYALRTLMYLAVDSERRSSVKEISEYHSISRNHLVKVVHRLAQLGCIETSKGKGGGIKLAEAALEWRLGSLISALEPHLQLAECFDAKTNTCRLSEACRLKHILQEAVGRFIENLNQHTVADLVKQADLVAR